MSENDDTDLSAEESISDEISERVRSVISAAESAATAIRHEAEQQAQIKRRAAEAEHQRFLEKAKAEAEALLEERMKRISELSDSLIEGGEKILMRIDGAAEVKRQLETMVHALASAAEELAAESGFPREAPRLRGVAVEDEPPAEQPRMRAVPEPEETASVTELRVPQKAEPEPEVAEPLPEAEPEVTEAEAPAAAASDNGPATKADVTPVEVVPADDSSDDDDVEVVDAVAVEDEPEAESGAERRNGAPAAEKPAAEPRGFDGDDMLAARLVALQMAVAGSARDEVEAHLRKTFELDEPGTILNDVFGAESKL